MSNVHVLMLSDSTRAYLEFVFKTHVADAIEPEELAVAGALWSRIKEIQTLEQPEPGEVGAPYVAEDGITTVPIQGPLTVVMSEEEAIRTLNLGGPDGQ